MYLPRRIREATAADLDAIVALDEAAFIQPWSRASFQTSLNDRERSIVIVMEEAGKVIAFGVAWHVGEEGEIATLAVGESQRGQGLGRAIMQALIERLAQRGVQQVFLEVRPSNAAALCLYENLNFQQAGRRRNYYANGEDALLMKLSIEQETG